MDLLCFCSVLCFIFFITKTKIDAFPLSVPVYVNIAFSET